MALDRPRGLVDASVQRDYMKGVAMRYFVTVIAPSERTFLELGEFDLDLVVGSAKRRNRSIEGVLELGEIGKLVDLGYEVMVAEREDARSRASEIISFDAWRKSVS